MNPESYLSNKWTSRIKFGPAKVQRVATLMSLCLNCTADDALTQQPSPVPTLIPNIEEKCSRPGRERDMT